MAEVQTWRGNTTTRDQHRAVIRRSKPPCGICGQSIDYSLRSPDPKSFVVDHIVPVAKGGPDTLDNKQAAHRDCNRAKSDKMPGEDIAPARVVRTFVTSRTW